MPLLRDKDRELTYRTLGTISFSLLAHTGLFFALVLMPRTAQEPFGRPNGTDGAGGTRTAFIDLQVPASSAPTATLPINDASAVAVTAPPPSSPEKPQSQSQMAPEISQANAATTKQILLDEKNKDAVALPMPAPTTKPVLPAKNETPSESVAQASTPPMPVPSVPQPSPRKAKAKPKVAKAPKPRATSTTASARKSKPKTNDDKAHEHKEDMAVGAVIAASSARDFDEKAIDEISQNESFRETDDHNFNTHEVDEFNEINKLEDPVSEDKTNHDAIAERTDTEKNEIIEEEGSNSASSHGANTSIEKTNGTTGDETHREIGTGAGAGAGAGSGAGTNSGVALGTQIRDAGELVALPGNRPPAYPQQDRALGREGLAVIIAQIRADGTVGNVSLERPSGSPFMDSAAVEAFKKWRFNPGQEGLVRKAFQFSLHGEAQAMPARLRRR